MRGRSILLHALTLALLCTLSAQAEDTNNPAKPTIRAMIGGLILGSDHLYVAESEVQLPLLRYENFSLGYRQHEITLVFKDGAQTQLLSSRYQLEGGYTLNDNLQFIGIGGYRRSALEDRAGSLNAYALGGGIGSPASSQLRRLEWSVTGGGYVSRDRLSADWWADGHLAWRAYEFDEGQMLETSFKPWLGLAADAETVNDGEKIRGFYRIGPALEVLSGNGNRARFLAQWFCNDGNPFMENRSSSLLLGVEVNASLDDTVLDARSYRKAGWLPLVWGQYDTGYGGERSIQRTELTAEIHDISIKEQLITAILWYESRQEYGPGDYDNISYSVSFGLQTPIGLASPLSQGKPLILGAEYLHRSSHVLSPDGDKVPPPTTTEHNSLNLLPRFRLQTVGWDLPYRDPDRYQKETRWLNDFDWRATLAWDVHHSRDRPNPAAQLGINWDAAAVQGCVLYGRALGSVGNETPDWQLEMGVRRPKGKLFVRYEKYGLEHNLARGNTFVVGIGFNL
jgi:hypothetical protein